MVAVSDDGLPLFLDRSREPTFAAPQATICQPTNLQPRLKSGFEVSPSLAATRASPFSRPSTTQSPQRSWPAGRGLTLSAGDDGGARHRQSCDRQREADLNRSDHRGIGTT